MKHIVKGAEPAEVTQFRQANALTPQNIIYRNLPMEPLRGALLQEQGYLCAYTMLQLETEADGHIEHIVAQSKSDVLATDYSNMVYCYPGKDVSNCKFGAGRKANEEIGVSPLDPGCEARFLFSRNGSVSCCDPADASAEATINVLALNHHILVEARKAAIARLPIAKTKRPLTSQEAKAWAVALSERDDNGKFPAFAAALTQVMKRYAVQKSASATAQPNP